MRLIDADALYSQIQIDPHNLTVYMAVGAFLHEVNKAPTVDAVPVVRCKDCIYRYDPHKSTTYLPCVEMRTASDWFCANGKRRG